MSSKIEWTDEVWNPVTGCEKVSPGCDHCYAATWAARRMGDWANRDFGEVRCHPLRLTIPLGRKKPTRYFVNSMSDLFHADVPNEFIDDVFATMFLSPQHTFQVLTKRPERLRRYARRITQFPDLIAKDRYGPTPPNPTLPLPNVWLGVSIESNDYAWRADMLRETPAAVRFLSIEPMLGPVDKVSFEGIDWVIVGGESGHGARPMSIAWVRDVRDRCVAAGIPFFFKQWGEFAPSEWGDATHAVSVNGDAVTLGASLDLSGYAPNLAWSMLKRPGKAKAGRELDGRTWDEFPAVCA